MRFKFFFLVVILFTLPSAIAKPPAPEKKGHHEPQKKGFVRLFSEKNHQAQWIVVDSDEDVPALDKDGWDFNDKAQSFKCRIPKGLVLILCGDANYGPWRWAITGDKECNDMVKRNKELSSVQWLTVDDYKRMYPDGKGIDQVD